MKITGAAYSFALIAVVSAITGCAKEVVDFPSPEKLEAALNGAALLIESESFLIETRDISEFQVLENFVGPEGKSASSVVKFTFQTPRVSYELEGTLSYVLKPGGELEEPFFEASVVTKL